MSHQDREKNKRLHETIVSLMAEPTAEETMRLGYCDRHRWLHQENFAPTSPCRNWQFEQSTETQQK